jgi:hypothetical protein
MTMEGISIWMFHLGKQWLDFDDGGWVLEKGSPPPTLNSIYAEFSFTWMCVCRPGSPLWSSGQSSWPRIQRSRFDSRRYQIFREVVGLERGPLSLVSTTDESIGSGLKNRDYGRRDAPLWSAKVVTNFADKRRSLNRYSSQTKATELLLVCRFIGLLLLFVLFESYIKVCEIPETIFSIENQYSLARNIKLDQELHVSSLHLVIFI